MSRVLLPQVQRLLRKTGKWKHGLPVLALLVLSLFTGRNASAISGGTYYIDSSITTGTSTTYRNFTSFLSDIRSGSRSDGGTSNGSGLSGNVTVIVEKGTYTGNLDFSSISGLTGTYTLTFDGGNGNKATRVLTQTASGTADAYVVRINALDRISFRNLTLRLEGNSQYYAAVVHMVGDVDSNKFENCNLILNNTSKTNYGNFGILYNGNTSLSNYYTGSNLGFNNSFDSCLITGTGLYHGAYLYGTSTSAYAGRWNFRYTTIDKPYYFGIYFYYISASEVINCNITTDPTYQYGYGIYMYYSYANSDIWNISNNYINATYNPVNFGYYIYGSSSSGTNGGKFYNNILTTGAGKTNGYVFYSYYGYNWNYYHNTIVKDFADTYTGHVVYMYYNYNSNFRNNIIANLTYTTGNYMMYAYGTSFGTFDYNTFWVAGQTTSYYPLYLSFSTYQASNLSSAGTGVAWTNPNVISAANPRLTDGCNPKGANLTSMVPKDIDMQTRSTTPNIGADEYVGLNDNMQAVAVLSPTVPLVATSSDVVVRLKNVGMNSITSGTVKYSLNGGTPVSVSLPRTVTVCDTVTVFFSTKATAASGVNVLKVWHESPNGNADGDATNDTITMQFCAPISGSLTVDPTATPSSTTFNTLSAALNYLYCGGINGPVTINVANGVYTEKIELTALPGTSASNRVTVRGTDSLATILQFNDGSASGYVLKLNSADYFTFERMTIRNTTTVSNNHFTVHMTNDADHNHFRNCIIRSYQSTSNYSSIIVGMCGSNYYSGANTDYNVIDNCILKGGYFGVVFYGMSTSNQTNGNKFINSVIDSCQSYASYGYYNDSLVIENNHVDNFTYNYSYGFNLYYFTDMKFNQNYVRSRYYGCQFGCYQNPANRNQINNNMFITTTQSGGYSAYFYYLYNTDITNNTFVKLHANGYAMYYYMGTSTSNTLRNNIFHNEASSGWAAYIYSNTSPFSNFSAMDYNIFYSNNSSSQLANINNTYYSDIATIKSLNMTHNQNSMQKAVKFANSPIDGYLDYSVMADFSPAVPGITVDVDGEPRCSFAPSIGADESKFIVPVPSPAVAPDTVYINSQTTMLGNVPNGFPAIGEWDMHNDGSLDATGATAEMTFTNLGLDSVMFTIKTCTGSSSIVRYVHVVNPSVPPTTDFIADINTVTVGNSVKFTNLTGNGAVSYNWSTTPSSGVTISPSNTNKNVTMTFNAGGIYEVCLEATNALGTVKKCKTAYIKVIDQAYMCLFPFETRATDGFMYDIGGPTLNYSKTSAGTKTRCGFLIDPCAADVSFKFTAFSLQTSNSGGTNGMDSVKLFNGTDNKAPLIGAWSQNNIPSMNFWYTASSGKMYVEFVIMNNCNGCTAPGFIGEWTSTPRSFSMPTPTIVAPDTAYTNVEFEAFVSVPSGAGNVLYDWDYENDGNLDILDDPYESQLPIYYLPGTYTLAVIGKGCAGEDTSFHIIEIVDPTAPPRIDFSADITNAAKSDVVTLTANCDLSTTGYDWEIYPTGKVVTKTGSNGDKVWGVQFSDTGYYTVRLHAFNDVGDDSLVKTAYIHVFDYCSPSASNLNTDIGINRVRLGEIDNSSASGVDGFSDYTSLKAELDLGASYTLTVDRNSALNQVNYKAWIDFNFDGVFSASEEVLNSGAISGTSASNTFTVSATNAAGATRMRVAASYGSFSNTACGPNLYGEYEDYRIVLRPDKTPPEITLTGADTVWHEIGYPYVDAGATAVDNLDGVITSSLVVTDNVNNMALGMYDYIYNVSDSRGNAATPKRRIVIITPDMTAPAITMWGTDTIVEVGSTYADAGAYAIDLVDGNVTSGMTTINGVNTAVVDTYYVDYSVTDVAGNTATARRRVVVGDLTAPNVTLLGNNPDTVEVNTTYSDPGATVMDNYYSGLTYTTSGLNMNALGTYNMTYTAVDGSGNTGTAVRTVVVVDRTAPVITLNGDDTILVDVFGTYTDPGETVTDNYWTGLTASKVGAPNFNVVGDYVISYTAIDGSSNSAVEVKRVIRVVDRKAPVLTLNGLPVVNHTRWLPYTDAGVAISDNYYTGMIPDTTSTVDVNTVGAYYVTYSLTDPSGNTATDVTRIVYVQENFTGINKSDLEAGINVYPNPTTGIVNISADLDRDVVVTVVNSVGQQIAQVQLSANGKQTIDISNYAAGLYLIKVSAEGQTVVKPINLVK